MKREKIDMSPERAIITNMITSDKFLRTIVPVFRPQLLAAGYAREVAAWIIEYWNHYKAAPGKDIQSVYQSKIRSIREPEDAENIADFLSSLSAEYEKSVIHNVSYASEQAVAYLKIRSLEILREQLDSALATGDPARGEAVLANYQRVAPPTGEGVDMLRDAIQVANAFMEEDELLLQLPGAAGRIFGNIRRGDFTAFLAPMKRGKTWFQWYLAETATYYGLKALFISFEMPRRDMIKRAWQSMVAQPASPGEIIIPVFRAVEDGKWTVDVKTEVRPAVDPAQVEGVQRVLRRRFRTGDLRLECFPTYGATVEDLDVLMDNMGYYDGFAPDILVVDYADIVRPSGGGKDYRHQLDDVWKKLRGMAQRRNIAVVTASQAEKSTFNEDVSAIHVAEDIRKFAHVTAMWSLNQTESEARRGLMRLGQIGVREGKKTFDQAVLTQCLDIGKPLLDSRLRRDVLVEDEEDQPAKSKRRPGRRRG